MRALVGWLFAILLGGVLGSVLGSCSTPAQIACLAGQSPCNGKCIAATQSCRGATPDMAMNAGGDMRSGCGAPAECPQPTTACKSATCMGGACGTSNAALGTPCSDSGGNVCDGNGTCFAGCATPADCPATTTTMCQASLCNPNVFMCMVVDAPQRVPCNDSGGNVCDGNGTCVGCVMASDCPSPTLCIINTCTSASTCMGTPAAPGTPCNDSGGNSCDDSGHCILQ